MNNNKLYSQFTSNSNKGIVWKLLCDNRTFSGIPEGKSNLIKEIFDKKITLLAEQINESSDKLIDLNKRVIGEMMVTGNNYKQQQQQQQPSQSIPEIYNASALSEQRQRKFQDEFNKKQNDFDSLTQVKIPDTPDFSDILDTPIGSEMDGMLAKQIAMREEQLNGVLNRQNTEEAKKWLELSNDDSTTNTTTQMNNDNIVKLKIGGDVNIDLNSNSKSSNSSKSSSNSNSSNSSNSPKKQVSFSDSPLDESRQTVDPDNFMALLKKKPTSTAIPSTTVKESNTFNNDNDITTILREILDKQNQILTLLQK